MGTYADTPYNANLVDACNPPTVPASGTGFVDDVNAVAFG
jgi:hypothetical protein